MAIVVVSFQARVSGREADLTGLVDPTPQQTRPDPSRNLHTMHFHVFQCRVWQNKTPICTIAFEAFIAEYQFKLTGLNVPINASEMTNRENQLVLDLDRPDWQEISG